MRRYTTNDAPPVRAKEAEHAKIERDVEAFLARGGSITVCPSGVSVVPELLGLVRMVRDEVTVAAARARVRRIRTRASKRGRQGR